MSATCDWCGKNFIPTPDNFTETGFSVFEAPDEADAWKGDDLKPVSGMPPEIVMDKDKPRLMDAMEIDEAQLSELMDKGSITTGIGCICWDCLDAGTSA